MAQSIFRWSSTFWEVCAILHAFAALNYAHGGLTQCTLGFFDVDGDNVLFSVDKEACWFNQKEPKVPQVLKESQSREENTVKLSMSDTPDWMRRRRRYRRTGRISFYSIMHNKFIYCVQSIVQKNVAFPSPSSQQIYKELLFVCLMFKVRKKQWKRRQKRLFLRRILTRPAHKAENKAWKSLILQLPPSVFASPVQSTRFLLKLLQTKHWSSSSCNLCWRKENKGAKSDEKDFKKNDWAFRIDAASESHSHRKLIT